jgi:hypothetical protein
MTIRYQLKPEAVTWLGSAFEQKTIVSPLSSLQVAGFQEEDKKSLLEQEIIDAAGALIPKAYEFFNELAGVESFAGFRVSGAFGKIDKIAYFKGKRVFWVDNAGGTYIFSEAKDSIDLLKILNEISGISHLVNASLDIELDSTAALIFASLADLTRQAALMTYAEKGAIPEGFSVEAILEGCKLAGGRWLGSYLRNLRLPGSAVNLQNSAAALEAMIEAGIAARNDKGGYTLLREAYAMAVNLLIIEHAFHLRIGKMSGGEILSGEALILQAGLHDVLMIDSDGQKIGFTSISTNAMHEYLLQMVTEAPQL